ncbi:MAG: LysR family transcriptional regulator [Deltaproteobacteria bacterium]|nr:LysR family transcriptional regulator [Deltaproteobacteria bacterium]
MSDEFDQIRVRDLVFFDRLAALGSITATARELGVPKPTASRWLAVLEQRVGQSLVRRTTRHAALTERGRSFHARVQEVLAAVRTAQRAAQSTEPRGTVRVSVPVPLGRMVGGPVIAGFRRELPQVRLEIALQNRRVDLVRDGFDLAIRGGPLEDSELIARRLTTVPLWLYASAEHQHTASADLAIIGAPGDEALLRRRRPDLQRPSVVVDDRSAVADALMHGAGAGILPGFLGEPARGRGELVRPDEQPLTSMQVHALYLPTQRDDPRLQILVDGIDRELAATLSSRP